MTADMRVKSIYSYWNQTPGLHHHKELKDCTVRAITASLKHYTLQEIHDAIFNYGMVLGDDSLRMGYKWTLRGFLAGKNSNCKDAPKNFWRYLKEEFDIESFVKKEGWDTKQQKTKLFPIIGRNCEKCKMPAVYKIKGPYNHFRCLAHAPKEVQEKYC